MTNTHYTITSFQCYIFDWWSRNKRDLPWRKTNDPYAILVSETMLQQTQVSRVIEKYTAFLNTFPSILQLSEATAADVIRAWKGLGYNRRAMYLYKSAQLILHKHNGMFPSTEIDLLALPGVGLYTARAIQVFAFHKDVSMIDTNIRKILTWFFYGGNPVSDSLLMTLANELVPKGRSWEWHQALMDFGSLELPKILKQQGISIVVPRQSRFIGSTRYYRGLIVNMLRSTVVQKNELINLLESTYGIEKEYCEKIILSLAKDGLIQITSFEELRLPQ